MSFMAGLHGAKVQSQVMETTLDEVDEDGAVVTGRFECAKREANRGQNGICPAAHHRPSIRKDLLVQLLFPMGELDG
jgi:hypothetical protein